MCKVTGSALIFLAHWLFGASTVYSKELKIEGGYRVLVPVGVYVEVQTPVEDFVLYNFKMKNETSFLTLYIGNQPKGYSDNLKLKQGVCTIDSLPDCLLEYTEIPENQDASGRNIYILLKADNWPQFAHFSYTETDLRKMAYVKEIIFSYRKHE